MAEFLGPEGDAAADAGVSSDSAAVGIALERARGRRPKTGDAVADRFLARQEELVAKQLHHLDEQFRHLRLRYFGDRLRIGLQLLAIVFGLAVAVGVGALVWQAHEADGVVIDAFSAPPDLAAKGLTGQVLASQLQDRLNRLQAATSSARPEASYSHSWGEDVKVEIPETGVSIGELQRLLRGWLGHETHIGGEVYHTPTGLGLTVRASNHSGDEVTGPEDDLPSLLQKGAEALYATTQPYRYGDYLLTKGRVAEARAVDEKLAVEGPPEEQAWALSALAGNESDPSRGEARARQALAIDPDLAQAWLALADNARRLSDRRTLDAATQRALQLLQGRGHGGYSDRMAISSHSIVAQSDERAGDYAACRKEAEAALALARDPTVRDRLSGNLGFCFALLHETSAARRLLSEAGETLDTIGPLARRSNLEAVAGIDENWAEELRIDQEMEHETAASSFPSAHAYLVTTLLPNEAVALGHLGRLAEAEAVMARDPTCPCLVARAYLIELRGDLATADRMRVQAAASAKTFPAFRSLARGRLRHGQWDAAIAAYRQGVAIAPAWADNYEGWGEALIGKGDMAGAIAKFQEAQKHAPRWARVHLKWGEALMTLGKRDEAKAQFKAAATMDLTADERVELAGQRV